MAKVLAGPGNPSAVYRYCDADGALVFEVLRFGEGKGKTFRQRRPDPGSSTGWAWNLDGVPRVPYHLPRLHEARMRGETVLWVVEGEKDADRLWSVGLVATTSPGGAGWRWSEEFVAELDLGWSRIVVVADDDPPGLAAGRQRAAVLATICDDVRLLRLATDGRGYDVSDFLDDAAARGRDGVAELKAAADAAGTWQPESAGRADAPDAPQRRRGPRSTADVLVEMAIDVEVFCDREDVEWALVPVGGRTTCVRLRSTAFRDWLAHRHHGALGRVPGGQALQDALEELAGRARYDAPRREVAVRLAGTDTTVWLDLGDEDWTVVEVDAQGWRLRPFAEVSDRVVFRRPKGTLALPAPSTDGSLEALRDHLALGAEDHVLYVAALFDALRPWGPHPVCELVGEHGTGKTTAGGLMRSLVDPRLAGLRRPPRDERDLFVAARNSWLVGWDNVSSLPADLSDGLCALASGAGFATRQLYTDAEEAIFAGARPVLVTGIDGVGRRADLRDRLVRVRFRPLPAPLDETRLREAWESVRPAVLGALLDAVVEALGRWPATAPSARVRMLDFLRWVEAGETALGFDPGTVAACYTASRSDAVVEATDTDPVARAVLELVAAEGRWRGSVAELADLLARFARGEPVPTAVHLGRRLRRLAPDLRALGVEVVEERTKHTRVIELRPSL